jgi:hypothetical protein
MRPGKLIARSFAGMGLGVVLGSMENDMRVSGFTFLRNAEKLGYPFVQSICSILPLVDEYVVALGPSSDGTAAKLQAIGDPKIRVIPTAWNEGIRNDLAVKGFVYGQQKSIALFNCTGDWAFYLEGDEVLHEQDLPRIRQSMEQHLHNPAVEALIFDYIHFYGNGMTYAWSPRWYRTAPRIIRNTIPAWAPKGLFFIVLDDHKGGRYPRGAHSGATIYHYGWVRSQEQMNQKLDQVGRFWSNQSQSIDYAKVDPQTLRLFQGAHPAVMRDWLPPAQGLFPTRSDYQLSMRERKHRWMLRLESWFGLELSKKHYRLVHSPSAAR